MRSFQQVLVLLFALVAFALGQSSEMESYDATVYITSTVYRVNTVTLSGKPTASIANQTSTIVPTPVGTVSSAHSANGTALSSGGSTPTSSAPSGEFTGAASQLNLNALVAVLAAGVGYMAL